LTAIAMPFVLLCWGRQFFYFVFGLLLLDMDNVVGFFAFGEAIHLNMMLLVKRIH
jgi:hypothetical protein